MKFLNLSLAGGFYTIIWLPFVWNLKVPLSWKVKVKVLAWVTPLRTDRHTGLYVNLTLYTTQSIQPVAVSLTIGASVQGYGEQCSEDLIYSTLTPLLIQVAIIYITQPNTWYLTVTQYTWSQEYTTEAGVIWTCTLQSDNTVTQNIAESANLTPALYHCSY